METLCVECGNSVGLPLNLEMGELVDCENCGVELEVKSTSPPLLMVFEEEEK